MKQGCFSKWKHVENKEKAEDFLIQKMNELYEN